jgi:hypothetical protein
VEIDLLRAAGRFEDAVAAAEMLLGRRPEAGPLNRARAHRIAGAALVALAEPGPARVHLDQALVISEAMHADFETAHALALLAQLDVPEREAARRRADELFESMGIGVAMARQPTSAADVQVV